MTAESESEMKSRMNESEAILRAREGDAEGFAYLYDSHRKHVYSVCLRMLKNSADAEDLMQQAFLQTRSIGELAKFKRPYFYPKKENGGSSCLRSG